MSARYILPAVIVLLGSATAALAGPSDELRRTAIEQVAQAGSVAGLARACGVEPTPITAAIHQLFNRVQLDRVEQVTALARYRAGESRMTREAQRLPDAPPCADLYSTMQETVIRLDSLGTRKSAAVPGADGGALAGE
jgi:transposase-like protein